MMGIHKLERVFVDLVLSDEVSSFGFSFMELFLLAASRTLLLAILENITFFISHLCTQHAFRILYSYSFIVCLAYKGSSQHTTNENVQPASWLTIFCSLLWVRIHSATIFLDHLQALMRSLHRCYRKNSNNSQVYKHGCVPSKPAKQNCTTCR